MYKDELQHIQKTFLETMKNSKTDPQGAVQKLTKLKEEVKNIFPAESEEYCTACATICEGIGDLYAKLNKPVEIEKSYKEMLQLSSKLYQMNKEKYDYRQAVSNYKLASLYRKVLQCHVPTQKPKQLSDTQKKLYGLTEALYKAAIAAAMEKAKKGSLRYVEMHSTVMSELAVLYACIGNYEKASEVALNGINVDKTIYDKHDDKAHGLKLAARMNILAVIYSYMKNAQKTAETLEDTIFVIERHIEEEPVAAGIMLARNYLNLGGAYRQIEEEKENAEEAFLKGLNKILEINTKSGDKMLDDVLMAYMLTADYYRSTNEKKKAKEHYLLAIENAKVLLERTKNVKYKNIISNVTKVVNGNLNS